MRKILPILLLSCCVAFANSIIAQQGKKPATKVTLPAIAAIRPSELEADLYDLAGDHFKGREAGTLDELKASAWLAEKARLAGLTPAGDDGTFFQFFSMQRSRIGSSSSVHINDSSMKIWEDVMLTQIAPSQMNAPLIFINTSDSSRIDSTNIKGKAVVMLASPSGINLDLSVPEWRYPGLLLRKYSQMLLNNGAAAVIFVADSLGEVSWKTLSPYLKRGSYDLEDAKKASPFKLPVIWFHQKALNYLKQPGLTLRTNITLEKFEYPSVNVVGKIQGTDRALAKEYVLFSGHQDHDGIGTKYGSDSIYNGADDNASVCVAMLAIARTFKAKPARRSALFVWHGAEERGLIGSTYYSMNPTVPKKDIVAVLNADMIGRNHVDSAALLGAKPPHMNSRDMVAMAHEANAEGPKFKLDTLWDKPEHPEVWYFRSDHLPYARAGIPALYFSSLLHEDYHTPMDEPSGINIQKLTRMTQWIYRTGWKIADRFKKPNLEANFKLER